MIRLAVGVLSALALGATACSSAPDPNAPREPASVQEQLPLGLVLGNLCPGAETPAAVRRGLRRQAEMLLDELETHPDWLVTYTFWFSDTESETKEITVRRLAQEQLQTLRDEEEAEQDLGYGPCEPELQRRLEETLG